MISKEQLDEILNDSEFSDCIKDAAPHRVKLIQDIGPKMKEHQKDFLEQMEKANYKDVANILAKLKLDKKDVDANAEYKLWKKDVMNMFRMILKSIHPNENQKPSVGMIYVAGKFLNYIGRNDIVQSVMEDKSITMTFNKLEDTNSYFDNDDIRAIMADIFQQADETQGEMCEHSDAIKKTYYDMLPSSVRYDAKSNKMGLKRGNFCALVKHKAMAIVKDADKYTKYINAQIESSNNNIDREEVMIGKTKQF